jgi:hypothetical protein
MVGYLCSMDYLCLILNGMLLGFARDSNHQPHWTAATVGDIIYDMVPGYSTSLGGVVGEATNSMALKLIAQLNSQHGFPLCALPTFCKKQLQKLLMVNLSNKLFVIVKISSALSLFKQ